MKCLSDSCSIFIIEKLGLTDEFEIDDLDFMTRMEILKFTEEKDPDFESWIGEAGLRVNPSLFMVYMVLDMALRFLRGEEVEEPYLYRLVCELERGFHNEGK